MTIRAINWNRVPDEMDSMIWDRLVTNFWVPERIALSNDLKSWGTLTDDERQATIKVFAGLTLLDTLQGTVGAVELIKDAQTLHEEAVLSNIVFMEAFASGTELLTPGGWKAIEDVTEDDLVAQFDPDTETTSFARPKIVPPHFSDEVYEIASGNGNARQVVSGGHRVYYEEATEKRSGFEAWVPAVVEARNLQHVNLKSAFRRFRSAAPAAPGAGMTDVDRLLVAINADGSFGGERYTGEKCGTIPVRFCFAKQRKIERLKALAESVGWRLKRVADSGDKENYYLAVPVEHAKDRSKLFNKWWNLAEVSSTWCSDFVEELGMWDGHTLKGGGGVTFYTSRKPDSDFVVAVSNLAGYRSRTTTRVDGRSETFSDSYVTNITWNRDSVGAQAMEVKRVDPQMVYCVQVPTTFLVTRNGESPVISGNCVHAKSYSSIFSTLCSSREIDEAFQWAEGNKWLQAKAQIIEEYYKGASPEMKKIASVMLESFLFYSGFFMPMYWSSRAKLTNTADLIRLIIRDEAVHGFYLGFKFQKYPMAPSFESEAKELLMKLYDLEVHYAREIYDPIGLTPEVVKFLKYNANKAMANLGFDPVFPESETRVMASVLSALDPGASESHDFFSGAGSSYVMAKTEDTEDGDWD